MLCLTHSGWHYSIKIFYLYTSNEFLQNRIRGNRKIYKHVIGFYLKAEENVPHVFFNFFVIMPNFKGTLLPKKCVKYAYERMPLAHRSHHFRPDK
jgi:hypothetical protein